MTTLSKECIKADVFQHLRKLKFLQSDCHLNKVDGDLCNQASKAGLTHLEEWSTEYIPGLTNKKIIIIIKLDYAGRENLVNFDAEVVKTEKFSMDLAQEMPLKVADFL